MANHSLADPTVPGVSNRTEYTCGFDEPVKSFEEMTCDPTLLFASDQNLKKPDKDITQLRNLQLNDMGPDMNLTTMLQNQANTGIANARGVPVSSPLLGHIHSRCGSQASFDSVGSSPHTVPEQYGQTHTEPEQTWNPEISKLSTSQRASKAANIRHSRSKKARGARGHSSDSSSSRGRSNSSMTVDVQREKNRKAAAKCRAKKKLAASRQEELANQYCYTTSILNKTVQDLKAEKTWLRNVLLAHGPEVCECHGIHEYNHDQAQRLVHSARCQTTKTTSPCAKYSGFDPPLVSPFA